MLPKDAQLKSEPSGGNFRTSLERSLLPRGGQRSREAPGTFPGVTSSQRSAEITGVVTQMLQQANNSNNISTLLFLGQTEDWAVLP